MDFSECFNILQTRQSQHHHDNSNLENSSLSTVCPCLVALTNEQQSSQFQCSEGLDAQEEGLILRACDELDALELISKFTKLQEERVKVSYDFLLQ